MMTKICSKCNKEKSVRKFYKHNTSSDGFQRWCKQCKKNYDKNNSEVVKRQWKNHYTQETFGLSVDEYEKLYDILFKEQNGRCKLCHRHQDELSTRMGIDHNHQNGQLRGLLCKRCNVRLAHIEDIDFVTKAQVYLAEYENS